jgi:hypothetical protein
VIYNLLTSLITIFDSWDSFDLFFDVDFYQVNGQRYVDGTSTPLLFKHPCCMGASMGFPGHGVTHLSLDG